MARSAQVLQYPVLALYRRILRTHQRMLSSEERVLGDAYVKAEFRLHRGASPAFMTQFERQWRDYVTVLARPEADGITGRVMTPEEVAALSDEQKVQLLKIREETAGVPKVS